MASSAGHEWEMMDAPTPCGCGRIVELDDMIPKDDDKPSSELICRVCYQEQKEDEYRPRRRRRKVSGDGK